MAAVVLPAVVSAVASGFSISAAGIAFSLTASSFLTSFATSLVLGGISRAFAPDKPKFDLGSGSFSSVKSGGITQQVRQPIVEHRIIYGQARVSGPLIFAGTTSNNKYLHTVVVLAAHELEAIDEVWINDTPIAVDGVDGSGVVNDGGFYDGLVRIKKHLGTAAQTADTDLVSEVSEWTTNHRGRGRAYLYVRYQFDRDKFSKIPNVSAYVRGKKVYDSRDAGTRFTTNPALMARDYLTSSAYGFGEATANVDDDFTDSAANECEEFVDTANLDATVDSIDTSTDIITLSVTEDVLPFQLGDRVEITTTGSAPGGTAVSTNYYAIPYQFKDTPRIQLATTYANALAYTADVDITSAGSGTHTIRKNGEPRYAGGGIINSSIEVEDNLKDILSAMGGQAVYAGGEWRLKAAAYETPTVTIDEDDIIGPIKIHTKVSRKDRFNRVKGVYVSPLNLGQPQDYPPVENSTYQTQDGEVIPKDYDLPFTQRPHTAQRLAKIELEKSRQEITATLICNLTAMQLQAGDTVYVSNTRVGWSSKAFEILEWKFVVAAGDEPQLAVQMLVRETASGLYDWNSGEETTVDPAPNTSLPNPFTVAAPTSLVVTPREVPTAAGDLTYEFDISWTAAADEFVTSGGKYEVEFKKSTESAWRTSYSAKGSDTSITVKQVDPGVNYDTRIRSVNAAGIPSSWQNLFGFNISSPSGATIQIDYGLVSGSVVESLDYGLVTESAADDQRDYGSIV